jgi:hypothetical protein
LGLEDLEILEKGSQVELITQPSHIHQEAAVELPQLVQLVQDLNQETVGLDQIGNLSGRSMLAAGAAVGRKVLLGLHADLPEVEALETAEIIYLLDLRLQLILAAAVAVAET